MMAVIEAKLGEEYIWDGTRRLRPFVLRLLMAAAHLFSADFGPRPGRQQNGGTAGGPTCRKNRAPSRASCAPPAGAAKVGVRPAGPGQTAPRAEWADNDAGKRDPMGKDVKN